MPGFVWHDLMARDVAAAKDFYAELLGWVYAPFGASETDYEVFRAGDHGWGGVMTPPDPQMPSMWLSYAAVADLEATVAGVPGAGGVVQVPPTPIPEVGRFAIVLDPEGAAIGLFESSGDPGPGAPSPIPVGGVEWVELATTDLAAALPFYGSILGWKAREVPMGPVGAYTILTAEGKDVAGAIRLPEEALARGARGHWLTYFSVNDVESVIATAERLGATTIFGPMAVAGVGRLAGFHDPQGAAFAVLEPER